MNEESVSCPACGDVAVTELHRFRLDEVANHLLPARRDRERSLRLRDELRALYGRDYVQVNACSACRFCFAHPFVAGTAEIYNLITGGHEFYPHDRFEFSLTIAALRAELETSQKDSMSLLEIGAGTGAFLQKAHDAGIFRQAVATEYDDMALKALRRVPGVEALRLTPQQLAEKLGQRFDAICMFQVLEHLDSLDQLFAALRTLSAGHGQLFVGVPNDTHVAAQEELTGFWDMPPNHIGRWNLPALQAIASRHGFQVLEHRYGATNDLIELWRLAKYRFEGRAYDSSSIAGRVNGLSVRWLRGILKRTLALGDLARLAPHYARIPPESHWFRLGAV